MTADKDLWLLQSLLDRLNRDAETGQPRFGGLVSDAERDALRRLIEDAEHRSTDASASTDQGSSFSFARPQSLFRPGDKAPREEESKGHTTEAASSTPDNRGAGGRRRQTRRRSSPTGTDTATVKLNTAVLQLDAPPNPDWTLCLDFGTAKSKAFAATDDEEAFEPLPLPIGNADKDIDGSVHAVSSSVWIEDDGRLFLGSEAVRKGQNYRGPSTTRRRLDSLKQEISQVDEPGHLRQVLPADVDPTSTLTYEDVITCYLAYLTDLAATALKSNSAIGTRYVKRRFTLPGWTMKQRQWAGRLITNGLMQAQILADTFHDRWRDGIPVNQVKNALEQTDAIARDGGRQTHWLLDTAPTHGILEALAAGAAQVWNDSGTRDVVLVIDVGAGTTDFSLFWVVQDRGRGIRNAWPIVPGATIKQAGDHLDNLLVYELARRANPSAEPGLKKRIGYNLRLGSVRNLKEGLFDHDRITVTLADDSTVNLSKKEFLNSKGVRDFAAQIEREIRDFLKQVHKSWGPRADRDGFTIILTGGGSALPMIRDLGTKSWTIGNHTFKGRVAGTPTRILEDFSQEFIDEYPQLAVAMGGALPFLIDEKRPLVEFSGKAGPEPTLPKQGFV